MKHLLAKYLKYLLGVVGIASAVALSIVITDLSPKNLGAVPSNGGLPGIYNATGTDLELRDGFGSALAVDENGRVILSPSSTVSGASSSTTIPNVEVYSTTTVTVYSTTTIPLDDTIPQIGEGSQFMSGTVTTQDASSVVRGQVTLYGAPSVNLAFLNMAFFRDSGANAVGACSIRETSELHTYVCEFTDSPGATGTYTYSARLGVSSGSFTVNGVGGVRFFGGVAETVLTLEEVLP